MLRNAALFIPPLLLAVACSSPTSFVMSRDVALTVENTAATTNPTGNVQVTLRYSIANDGNHTLRFLGLCSPASLTPDGGAPIDLTTPCTGIGAREILPGGTLTDSTSFSKPEDVWGPTVTGEYVLRLGVFVEGRSRVEQVTSAPFLIQLQTAEGT